MKAWNLHRPPRECLSVMENDDNVKGVLLTHQNLIKLMLDSTIAGVVTAIAAIAATTAASSGAGVDEQMAKTDMAVTSAATLVAAQCVEMAEAMGADCEHLASVVGSAANVRSAGGIMTLIVSVATLKARALKQVWNIAVAITVEAALDRKHNGPALLWKMISCIFIVVGSAPVEIL
ncbi:VAN3-binding protein [Vitis vinifera]|uniref:VAN3-binding protein n=1 Tax=Vitis vinifera TaxID=29760 RepID=A0A438JEJ5_VITVI|nr:VAN3-binding protein [Vitis vinifera]